MSNCCCNANNDEYPDDIAPCCGIQGPRCICLPYDDAWLITGLVLPIIAVLIGWLWWATWLITIMGMAIMQILWCCRNKKGGILSIVILSGLEALIQFGYAIYILVKFPESTDCWMFWGDHYTSSNKWAFDDCPEGLWAGITFVNSFLWFGSAFCLWYFVWSGRHAKWEKLHKGSNGSSNGISNNHNNSAALELASTTGARTVQTEATTAVAMAVPALPPPKVLVDDNAV